MFDKLFQDQTKNFYIKGDIHILLLHTRITYGLIFYGEGGKEL